MITLDRDDPTNRHGFSKVWICKWLLWSFRLVCRLAVSGIRRGFKQLWIYNRFL
jgi:hypothetical protein